MKDQTNQLKHMKTTLAVERHRTSCGPRLVGSLLCLLLWAGTAMAQTSATSISFQGALNGPGGAPLANGVYDLRFRFWDGPAPGGNAVSTNILAPAVPVTNGLASTAIPVDPAWFNGQTRFLGVSVGGGSELLPRVLVTAVPMSMKSSALSGAPFGQWPNLGTDFTVEGPLASVEGSLNVTGAGLFNGNSLFIRNPSEPAPGAQTWGFVVDSDGSFYFGKSTDVPDQGNLVRGDYAPWVVHPDGAFVFNKNSFFVRNWNTTAGASTWGVVVNDPVGTFHLGISDERPDNGNLAKTILLISPYAPEHSLVIGDSGDLAVPSLSVTAANGNSLVLDVNGTTRTTVLQITSDRRAKQGFEPVDRRDVLGKLATLPLTTWAYTNAPSIRHIGPVAQDFAAAFGVGSDDQHITTVDADGVALAAIQGLNEKLEEQVRAKDAKIESLENRLAELERLVTTLAGRAGQEEKATTNSHE
jgi:hypothetical protein